MVLGSGLFGSTIAARLRQDGHDVCVIDAQEPTAGSNPAACLMRPSWFSSLGREVTDASLRTLDDLYGLHNLRFRVKGVGVHVYWCDPAKILRPPDLIGRARRVVHGDGTYRVDLGGGQARCRSLVVAMGVWTRQLLPLDDLRDLKAKAGVAFLLPNVEIREPFIEMWAPYKQIVAFNRGDGLWIGDGTAINEENWTALRGEQSRERCARALERADDRLRGLRPYMTPIYGVRPYLAGHKPCYLRRFHNMWVATGGAKNGTLAAGWCAHEIARQMA